MEENKDLLMDWSDSIDNEGQEFIVLEEGDYVFEVTKFERGRYPGSAKIPLAIKQSLPLKYKLKKE